MTKFDSVFLAALGVCCTVMFGKRIFLVSPAIFCFLIVSLHSFTKAGENLSGVDEFDKFVLMSDKERTTHLAQAFEKRMRHAKNLSYRVEVSIGWRDPIKPGTDGIFSRKVYEHKILEDSYTMQIDDPLLIERGRHEKVFTFLDGNEGITKSYVNVARSDSSSFSGRIDTTADPIVWENFYTRWLGGKFLAEFQFADWLLFPCLLRHKDRWTIEIDSTERMVKLTSPYPQLFEADKFDGYRKLVLDPRKGFMPSSGEYRHEATFKANGITAWSEERFVVEDSLLVGDVWMPTKMTSEGRSHDVNPGAGRYVIMNVTEMRHGQVSKADMSLKFPEGTSVVDAINGIAYKTDARGNPIQSTIEPLYGLDPSQVKLPEPPKSKVNLVLTTIGIVMILVGLYLAIRKRLR